MNREQQSAPGDRDAIVVGRVVGVFGLRGELKVEAYTDEPSRFQELTRLYVGARPVEVEIERARAHKRSVVLKLAGVDTVDEAATLVGMELWIPREEARALDPNEFFLQDILGAAVYDTEGASLGTVVDVLVTGGNEVFVVGGASQQLLVPAIQDALAEFSVANKRVVVQPWVLAPYI